MNQKTQSVAYQSPTAIRLKSVYQGTVTELETVYDIFGDPADPTVLLIAGLGAQMISWDEQFCAQLAGYGFRVIRFDNRDAGLATKFDGVSVPAFYQLVQARLEGNLSEIELPYYLGDMAADTVALLDELGVDQAHIVGASMGGGIAQLLAIHYPDRVSSLTAIMTSSGRSDLPLPKPEALQVFMRPGTRDRTEYIDNTVEGWRLMHGTAYPFDEGEARLRAACFYDRAYYPEGSARQLAATVAVGSLKPMLTQLVIPTLVIHGDEDPLFPVECGRDIAESIPGAKMLLLEGVGHSLPKPIWSQVLGQIAAGMSLQTV